MIVSHLTYHIPLSMSSVVSGVLAYLKIQQLSLCLTLKTNPTSHHVDILTSTFAGDDTTVSYKIIKTFGNILIGSKVQFSSVKFSCSVISNSLRPHRLQHARLPCPSPTPGVSNLCPLSQWYHPTISSSVVLFSFRLQSFPASGSLSVNQFQWGGWNWNLLYRVK